jgi:outer membrane receptor protein involved in Fe transport
MSARRIFPLTPLTAALLLLHAGPADSRAPSPAPFTVSGIVVDAKGKPLPDITVSLQADFVYGRAEATTGADGRYQIGDLIRATYRAQAWIKAPYAGRVVCHRLAMDKPTDYNSFPVSAGAERNFRWQMSGRIGLSDSYLGASIRIWNSDSLPPDPRGAVEFTLTPTGPLLDGSPGTVIVRRASMDVPGAERGIDDVPLAAYRLKAEYIGGDGRRTRLGAKAIGTERFAPEIDVVWNTESRCGFGTDNGTNPLYLELMPASR